MLQLLVNIYVMQHAKLYEKPVKMLQERILP